MRALALLPMFACSHGEPAPKPSEPLPVSPLTETTQAFIVNATELVTAVADDWNSTKVTIARWRPGKSALDPRWERVGEPWEGVVGNAGLAWGDGLHGNGAPKGHDGPAKHEGDGRSPAGAFRITRTFGTAQFGRLPYVHITDATECVDDPKSAAYNTIVEHTGSADWTSAEHMNRPDGLYDVGAVIDHNPERAPGAGSCIFLHIWSGPDSTTVGCTAMDKLHLENLLTWSNPGTVFVLLPRAEYRALRDQWGLPPQ